MGRPKGSIRQKIDQNSLDNEEEGESETAELDAEIEAIEAQKAEIEVSRASISLHRAALDACPLFIGTDKRSTIDKIWVSRTLPPEGHLGKVEPTSTEEDIFNRWGGGDYLLMGRSVSGQIIGKRIMVLAGEPKFMSLAAENNWRKQNGLKPKPAEDSQLQGVQSDSMSVKDMMLLMQQMDEKRQTEIAEREEKHRRERDEMEARRKADESEREERRRKIAQEDEERRDRRHREDMERLAVSNQAQIQQTQSFFAEITKLQRSAQPSDGGVSTLVQGMQLMKELGGGSGDGEGSSPLTAFLSRLPETLAQAREVAGAAYSEIAGKGHSGATDGEDSLTIKGPSASKLKAAASKLIAEGKDPEQLLSRLADTILAQKSRPASLLPQDAKPIAVKARKGTRGRK